MYLYSRVYVTNASLAFKLLIPYQEYQRNYLVQSIEKVAEFYYYGIAKNLIHDIYIQGQSIEHGYFFLLYR